MIFYGIHAGGRGAERGGGLRTGREGEGRGMRVSGNKVEFIADSFLNKAADTRHIM